MDKIKRFFECLVPETVCNLMCDYCYVIQQNRRSMKLSSFMYSPEYMLKGLSKDRLGGTCFFSICGAGETLMQHEVVDLTIGLLNLGHYVNLTNNGTQTDRIDELLEKGNNLEHLHFSFSLHFLELERRNLIDTFFENVKRVKEAGCSFIVQLNMYDGYMPRFNEIKELCLKNIGALPQVPVTRDESVIPYRFHTSQTEEYYCKEARKYDSPLFEFTLKNFNKKRHEFCYAGDWSALINFSTGIMTKCYANSDGGIDIFHDINSPINFSAVGNECKNLYCVNSSHFMSLGIIPSIATPSYADLRNRICIDGTEWYSKTMKDFLNTRLYDTNKQYPLFKKLQHYYGKTLIRKVIIKMRLYPIYRKVKTKFSS